MVNYDSNRSSHQFPENAARRGFPFSGTFFGA
jgi:hypothetical protein